MRMRWLARMLLPRMKDWAKERKPDFEVHREEGGAVYLRRWWVVPRNNILNVYLHNMLLSDDDILHDHPYWSLSLVLTDGLVERYTRRPYLTPEGELIDLRARELWEYAVKTRVVRQGDLVLRSGTFAHQLIVKQPAWTLFVTGPRFKEWGFWCPRGFVHWKKYVATNQDPSGVGSGTSGKGRGCGED